MNVGLGLPLNWAPRDHQLEVWRALTKEKRPRVDVVALDAFGDDVRAVGALDRGGARDARRGRRDCRDRFR